MSDKNLSGPHLLLSETTRDGLKGFEVAILRNYVMTQISSARAALTGARVLRDGARHRLSAAVSMSHRLVRALSASPAS